MPAAAASAAATASADPRRWRRAGRGGRRCVSCLRADLAAAARRTPGRTRRRLGRRQPGDVDACDGDVVRDDRVRGGSCAAAGAAGDERQAKTSRRPASRPHRAAILDEARGCNPTLVIVSLHVATGGLVGALAGSRGRRSVPRPRRARGRGRRPAPGRRLAPLRDAERLRGPRSCWPRPGAARPGGRRRGRRVGARRRARPPAAAPRRAQALPQPPGPRLAPVGRASRLGAARRRGRHPRRAGGRAALRARRQVVLVELAAAGDEVDDHPVGEPLDRRAVVGERALRRRPRASSPSWKSGTSDETAAGARLDPLDELARGRRPCRTRARAR